MATLAANALPYSVFLVLLGAGTGAYVGAVPYLVSGEENISRLFAAFIFCAFCIVVHGVWLVGDLCRDRAQCGWWLACFAAAVVAFTCVSLASDPSSVDVLGPVSVAAGWLYFLASTALTVAWGRRHDCTCSCSSVAVLGLLGGAATGVLLAASPYLVDGTDGTPLVLAIFGCAVLVVAHGICFVGHSLRDRPSRQCGWWLLCGVAVVAVEACLFLVQDSVAPVAVAGPVCVTVGSVYFIASSAVTVAWAWRRDTVEANGEDEELKNIDRI